MVLINGIKLIPMLILPVSIYIVTILIIVGMTENKLVLRVPSFIVFASTERKLIVAEAKSAKLIRMKKSVIICSNDIFKFVFSNILLSKLKEITYPKVEITVLKQENIRTVETLAKYSDLRFTCVASKLSSDPLSFSPQNKSTATLEHPVAINIISSIGARVAKNEFESDSSIAETS